MTKLILQWDSLVAFHDLISYNTILHTLAKLGTCSHFPDEPPVYLPSAVYDLQQVGDVFTGSYNDVI